VGLADWETYSKARLNSSADFVEEILWSAAARFPIIFSDVVL